MNALLRRRLEMAGRVRDFLRAHKTDAVGEGLGLAKLEELIARAEALDAQQRAGIVTTRLSTKHREGLRRALQSKLLLYLRALGGLGDPENGEAAVQFQVPPSNASHQALLTAGRDMLEKAKGQKDVLLSRGMPPTLLDDLAGVLGGLGRPSKPRGQAGAIMWVQAPISRPWAPRSRSRCERSTGWCVISSAIMPS